MLPHGRFRTRGGCDLRALDARPKRASWCKDCERPGVAVRHAKRRALEQSGVGYTVDDVRRLMVLQHGLCAYCHRDLRVCGYHVDHKHALARGGGNHAGNIQLLCPKCNLSKGAR